MSLYCVDYVRFNALYEYKYLRLTERNTFTAVCVRPYVSVLPRTRQVLPDRTNSKWWCATAGICTTVPYRNVLASRNRINNTYLQQESDNASNRSMHRDFVLHLRNGTGHRSVINAAPLLLTSGPMRYEVVHPSCGTSSVSGGCTDWWQCAIMVIL